MKPGSGESADRHGPSAEKDQAGGLHILILEADRMRAETTDVALSETMLNASPALSASASRLTRSKASSGDTSTDPRPSTTMTFGCVELFGITSRTCLRWAQMSASGDVLIWATA
jgi:hypothetical protein